MKKFLVLQIRPEDEASDNELEAFCNFGKLTPSDVHRIRMEAVGVPELALDDYSAVIIGGGPSNVSDAPDKKTDAEKKFENELAILLREIVDRDFPTLGACYGIGAIASFLGARVSKEKYGESVGATHLRLTDAGKTDPLLKGLPEQFDAFCGHKEACQEIPEGAELLITSDTCPVQMIRYKQNIYATQFHPELDTEGLITRINVYKHAGYFPAEDADVLIAQAQQENVFVPEKIFERFVERYRCE